MKVRVNDLTDEARELVFEEPAAVANATVDATSGGARQSFEGTLRVRAEVYRSGTDVHLAGDVAADVRAACPRCLDEFCWPLTRRFRLVIVAAGSARHESDDIGADRYEGEEVDVAPFIAEQAVLALDDSRACADDCRGLCAGCGANLNREPCGCRRAEEPELGLRLLGKVVRRP